MGLADRSSRDDVGATFPHRADATALCWLFWESQESAVDSIRPSTAFLLSRIPLSSTHRSPPKPDLTLSATPIAPDQECSRPPQLLEDFLTSQKTPQIGELHEKLAAVVDQHVARPHDRDWILFRYQSDVLAVGVIAYIECSSGGSTGR